MEQQERQQAVEKTGRLNRPGSNRIGNIQRKGNGHKARILDSYQERND
jgi:hypothetical protein